MGETTGCLIVDGVKNLLPGWGCCACRGYNGAQRETCRTCGHAYCGPKYEIVAATTVGQGIAATKIRRL